MPKAKPSGIKATIQKNMSIDYFICTLAVCISATVCGGQGAFLRIAFCGLVGVILDLICSKLILKSDENDALYSVSQGMIIALLLPADIPFYICFIALSIMVFVAKLPFGAGNKVPFVPCAVGICFVYAVFSQQCFDFGGTSVAEMLKMGDYLNLNVFSVTSILCGNYPGAVGTCAVLPLLGVGIYLFIRQRHKFYCFSAFVLVVSAFAVVFPKVSGSVVSSLVMELSAGSLLFTALFLLPESIYLSRKGEKAFLFGAVGGAIAMLLRYVSPLADSAPFSVMLLCALWPLFGIGKPKMKSKIVYKKAGKGNER